GSGPGLAKERLLCRRRRDRRRRHELVETKRADEVVLGESRDGAWLEARAGENEPRARGDNLAEKAELCVGERAVEEAEHRPDSGVSQPDRVEDLRGQVGWPVVLYRDHPVYVEELQRGPELRREEIPLRCGQIGRKPRVGQKLARSAMDRDRNASLQDPLAAEAETEVADRRRRESEPGHREMAGIERLQGEGEGLIRGGFGVRRGGGWFSGRLCGL